MSLRGSDDGDSTTTSSSSLRRSRGILDRLRGARNSNKQKERKAVLDVLQNIRLKANTPSSSFSPSYSFSNRRGGSRGSDEDDITAATTAAPSLASTATSGYTRNTNTVFSRKPIAFSHLHAPSLQMRMQSHSIPSIASTTVSDSSTHYSSSNSLPAVNADITSRTGSSTGRGHGLAHIFESGYNGNLSPFNRPMHAPSNHEFRSFRHHDRSRSQAASTNAILAPLYSAVSAGAPRHVMQSLIAENQPSVAPSFPMEESRAAASGNHYRHAHPQPAAGGMPPLHCAIERYDTPVDVLLLLLAANPRSASIRCDGCHAIDLLYKRYVEPAEYRSNAIKARASLVKQKLDAISGPPFSIHRQMRAQHALQESADLSEFWETLLVFVQAAWQGFNHSCANALFHATVAMDCEPLIICFAAALHPEQVRDNVDDDDVNAYVRNQLPLHLAAANQTARTTKAVLRLYPQAANRTDSTGRLPLHYAILRSRQESGSQFRWEDGVIEALLASSPKSYSAIDPQTGLTPVLLAAASAEENEMDCCDEEEVNDVDQLNTIFALVSVNPMILVNQFAAGRIATRDNRNMSLS
jgi:hypothetical protein